MNIFFHNNQLAYQPKLEFDGSRMRKYPENPNRVSLILNAIDELENESLSLVTPPICNESQIAKVHTLNYIKFLHNIPNDIGEVAPTGFAFPNPRLNPSSFHAKLGNYFFDPATPITSQTYKSAIASASSAIACVRDLQKNSTSIGLCRPPGHHAFRSMGGGYCFFNNIAIAAQLLVNKGKSVTIFDFDYHHGNGTQEIFYNSSKVQYVSIHANPEISYPFYWGSSEEKGIDEGSGFNVNIPISATSSEDQYRTALSYAMKHIEDYNADIILLSAGFDCYFQDSIAGMGLTAEFYAEIGEKLSHFSKIGIILEGGYHNQLGKCFLNLLNGLQVL